MRGLHSTRTSSVAPCATRLLARVEGRGLVVPGVDYDGLARCARAAREGRGARGRRASRGRALHPRDKQLRPFAPAGIEFAPPAWNAAPVPAGTTSKSSPTPSLSIEADMGRRDFTVNAIARRLETGEILDPFGGEADLKNGCAHRAPAQLRRGSTALSCAGSDSSRSSGSNRMQRRCPDAPPKRRASRSSRVSASVAGSAPTAWGTLEAVARGGSLRGIAALPGTPAFSPRSCRSSSRRSVSSRAASANLPLDEHIFEVVQAAATPTRRSR